MGKSTTTTKPLILLGDDDPDLVAALRAQICQWGFNFAAALNKGDLFEQLRESSPALVLLDLQFGNHDGLDVYAQLVQKYPSIPVVFLTAYGSIDTAVTAIKLGAYDYLTKPPDFVRLKLICTHAVERYVLSERVERWEQLAESQASHQQLLGSSPLMQSLRDTIVQVAPTAATVLIVGESGTGKELVAREIHARSGRNGLFVPVNMGSLPSGLVESALFGHDRGAFTGADRSQKGWCELADGGTLFLDEIGEMELSLQPKLLRFLQEQTVQRVGGGISQRVNVRILAATHRNPLDMLRSGQLREDLYYRLNVFPIEVSPLRERREDIPLIATAILEQSIAKNGKPACWFGAELLDVLTRYDWPGNVRQLENVVHRLVIVSKGGEIGTELLPPEMHKAMARSIAVTSPADESLTAFENVEKRTIEDALRRTGGNVVRAAEQLGLGQATIYRKIRQYGIARKSFAAAKARGDSEDDVAPSELAGDEDS